MARQQLRLNDMASAPCDCQGCDHRTPECHATCEAYRAYREEADRRSAERLRRRELERSVRRFYKLKTVSLPMKKYKE